MVNEMELNELEENLGKDTTIKVKRRTLKYFNIQKIEENFKSQNEFVYFLLRFFVENKGSE